MKKILVGLLAGVSILSLVACSPKRYERNNKPVTTQSSTVKKDKKKDTGQKQYDAVLDRYRKYEAAINSGDSARIVESMEGVDPRSDELLLVGAIGRPDSHVQFEYTYMDVNKDGQDELLIGSAQYLTAIYYLKNQKPTLLRVAYIAPVGGERSSLNIYDNGQIVHAYWRSIEPEMQLTLYNLTKGNAKEEKQATIQIGGDQKQEDALGITAKAVDLTKLEWKSVSDDLKETEQSSEAKSSDHFQVRVSVSDLRIRKEPSKSAASSGMIAQGTYTITETKSADGYTWGKLESGQGWIALEFTTRLDGSAPAPSNTSSGSMNLQEIQNGNFSSIAGTWRNGKGNSLTFNANGTTVTTEINVSVERAKIFNGMLQASSQPKNSPVGGAYIFFAPQNTIFPIGPDEKPDASNQTKDRLLITQWGGVSDPDDFYYRVD